MPSLRTRHPGFPKYSPRMIRSLGLQDYQSIVKGLAPVAYWPLTESAGGSAADLSGNALTASYTSCTLANRAGPGPSMGMAPYFDGVVSYVQLPAAGLNSLFDPTRGTIAIWVLPFDNWSDTTLRDIVFLGDASAQNYIGIYRGNAALIQNRVSCAGSGSGVAHVGISGQIWKSSVMTWDRSANQIYAYLNGTQVGPSAMPVGGWGASLANGGTRIGYSFDAPWKGWLAHAAIWNRVLAAPEIATLATAV